VAAAKRVLRDTGALARGPPKPGVVGSGTETGARGSFVKKRSFQIAVPVDAPNFAISALRLV
jgi:hypothetical protein